MNTHILVATDGGEEALGALRLAAQLSRDGHGGILLLGVVEPVPYHGFGSEYSPPSLMDAFFKQQIEGLRESIRRQVMEVVGTALEWPIRIEIGSPAPTIARVAAEAGATRIVLGHAKHDALDRWFGSETAPSVVQLAHVPVLAVDPSATTLPRTVLVAVDFSTFSREAAVAAVQLAEEGAAVYLAHVSSFNGKGGAESTPEWVQTYNAGVLLRLEELADELRDKRSVRVRTRLISGEQPAPALLALAEEVGADLVAAGSHGLGFFGRLIVGSVSTRLLRRARSSVLIVPSHTAPTELHERPALDAAREAHVLGTSLPRGVLP